MKNLDNIPFNIWDDYNEDKKDGFTHGYIEEYDVLNEDQKIEIINLIFQHLKAKLKKMDVEIWSEDDRIYFRNLSHFRRECLVEDLQMSGLQYNGLSIRFYSES